MPLTTPAPPQRARPVHEREINAAAASFGNVFGDALHDLITRLCFSHSEWWFAQRGGTYDKTHHLVSAALLPGPVAGTGGAASYQSGSANIFTNAQLQRASLVVVIAVLMDKPATYQRFTDGLLKALPSPPKLHSLPSPEPSKPSIAPLRRETLHEFIRQEGNYLDDVIGWGMRMELITRFLSSITRFDWGIATSIDTTNKVATVKWYADGAPITTLSWGTRAFTRTSLVGKQVRVAITPVGSWIDDIDQASGRV